MKLVVRGKTLNVFVRDRRSNQNEGFRILRTNSKFIRCNACMRENNHGTIYYPLYTDKIGFVICGTFKCKFDIYV